MKRFLTLSFILLSGLGLAQTSPTSFTVERSASADFSAPTTLTVTSATTYGVTGLTPGSPYYFRVRGSNGTTATLSPYASTSVTTPGVAFVIRETVRIALQTNTQAVTIPTGTTAISQAVNWNYMRPTASQITSTTAGTYSLNNLVAEGGGVTSYSVGIGQPWTVGTGSSFTTVVANSLYPPEVNAKAWQVNSALTAGGSIVLRGLNPADYIQVYLYGVTGTQSTGKFTLIGATTTEQTRSGLLNNTGVGGGNEFDPNTALVYFKNVRPAPDGTLTVLVNNAGLASTPLNIGTLRFSTAPAP